MGEEEGSHLVKKSLFHSELPLCDVTRVERFQFHDGVDWGP